ncbi:MAG: hypothetical protein IPM97_15135 [Bdellovibrionaceae bacterium]|jgi:hypothetical protein|nr:hypothetical protein [Pseudobdellovibrionaceae bacterium]
MQSDDKKTWLKEYTEFAESDSGNVTVPPSLFENLRKRIFPNPWKVFAKMFAIHGVVGFLSLGICNQFGLNPFQTEYSLMNWFMKIAGHSFCMVFCGVLFMATSFLLANFFLSLEELESIKRHQWLQTSVIGLTSLAAFYFFGAELVATFAGLWILGALLGGFFAIEGSYRLRRSFS